MTDKLIYLLEWIAGIMEHPQLEFMKLAIDYAIGAAKSGDYGIGAVLVSDLGEVTAAASNGTKINQDPTRHAELIAIRLAATKLMTRHLGGLVLYTTHEPCSMCTSAAVWSRLKGIVYGASIEDMKEHSQSNNNGDYLWRTINIGCREIIQRSSSDNGIFVIGPYMQEECKQLFKLTTS